MKETANCICRKCGCAFTKELFESGSGAGKRLREKVAWAEGGGIDLCPDCYKAEQRAVERAEGLTCTIRLSNVFDAAVSVCAVFGGDAYTHRDALKAAGARYTDRYPNAHPLNDVLGVSAPRKAWCIFGADVDDLITKAEELGAKVSYPSEGELAAWAALRKGVEDIRAKDEAAMQAELAALGEKPAWPESVSAKWPKGATWNTKVYGKRGNYRIYLSGAEISLTDDEADGMRATLAAREAWRKAEAAIKSRYGR